ncbi:hypothetical protein JAO71_11415 [Olleya sp. YSTF-M6]|uniref:Uncharacterized protein n=1 Tax=Olleya sediminilitoris TaxID=2795739 RepID=A0ABS1WMQ5_9FLAO|nr:hypothetical protein [Olleya sediminilitoris]MBL7560411.1 hypothetical protein [Olleya sediminilitoris]
MRKTSITLILTLITIIFTNCSSDESPQEQAPQQTPEQSQDVINIEDARLLDFPLLGITPVSINITQPTIVNNQETNYGEINIIISNTISLNGIASAITSNELNLSKFNILPGQNTNLNYETQSQIHTIVNVLDETEELLHYTVTIEHEATSTLSTLTVTDFRFEGIKNSQLTDDVIIERRVTNVDKEDIYLFVPAGTDFSDLTPTVTFDAEEVFYTQDSSISIINVDTPYPTGEISFNFSYPKRFIIVMRDDANNRIKWTNVFVDVKNPVEIENPDLTTPDIITSNSSEYFTGITRWKNIGNHKIEYQSATMYENKVPDINTNLITATRVLIGGGLAPGESANVNVQIIGNLPVGTYKTTAVFFTRFTGHNIVDDLIESSNLNIMSNIIN